MNVKFPKWGIEYGAHRFMRGRRSWVVTGVIIVLLLAAAFLVTIPSASPHNRGIAHSSAMGAAATSSSTSSSFSGMAADSAAGSVQTSSGGSVAEAASSAQQMPAFNGKRLVIETANLDLSVKNLTHVDGQITALTNRDGGFIESMNQSIDSQGQTMETLTVRIPEGEFSSVLNLIKTLGTVNTFSQTGQDVTNQHDNLQQQISELQSEADAYTRLFSKATTMSDMLQIQQSLTQVNSEISNLNNQLHQLNRTVQFATVSLTLHASTAVMNKGAQTPLWMGVVQSFGLMKRLFVGFVKVVLWLLPWLLLVGVGYAAFRLARWGGRVRRKK